MSKAIGQSALIWLCPIVIFLFTPAPALSIDPVSLGPIKMRNHHPLYTGLLYPPPESATIVRAISYSAALNYTNIFIFDSEGRWSAFIDKDLAEMSLSVRYPVANWKAEIGLDAPFYYSATGVTDGSVRWLHSRAGVPGYSGQKVIPDYNYSDVVRHDGRPVMIGAEGEVSPGDATFWIKAPIFSKGPLKVSFQGLTQAPTGNADQGEGSGEWEFGARALATILDKKSAVHLGAGAMAPGRIKRSVETTDLNIMYTGFVSYEHFIRGRLSLVAQSMFNSSPFVNADLERFRKTWVEATFGFKYRREDGSIVAFGLSENLNGNAPDFTIHFSLER